MADGEAARGVFGERAEAAAHALTDRLQGLEAGAAAGGMDADALGAVVVHGDKHRGLTFPLSTWSSCPFPTWHPLRPE